MDNYGYYGYGARRKRNIRFQREEASEGINWGTDGDLEEEIAYEEEVEEVEPTEEMNSSSEYDTDLHKNQLYLNGKPFTIKSKPVKQSFTETHVRITTYLEKNVHQIIRMLQKQGQIDSITSLVNESIKAYLLSEFHDRNHQ